MIGKFKTLLHAATLNLKENGFLAYNEPKTEAAATTTTLTAPPTYFRCRVVYGIIRFDIV